MPLQILDASSTPPIGVASPAKISVFVGNPPRELLIFTGVAIPEWDSLSNLDYEDLIVKLPGVTTPFFQATSTVSLASIVNTDSDFTFAANESSVVLGPGGLELHVQIAVQGEKSILGRLSYHVQVLSDPVTAKVSGNIRWNQSLSDPTEAAKNAAVNMFRVAAGAWVSTPGGGGLGSASFIEKAFTLTTTAPVLAGGVWAVPYTIDDVPLGEQLQITPSLLGGLLNPPSVAVFAPTPQNVLLTPAVPMVTGIDFELTDGGGVH